MLNVANRTLFTGDNLDVMRGINSECIDLIYLDPPFNSNQDFEAPIGSPADGAEFTDNWTLDDIDVAWHGHIAEEHPGLYAIIDAAGECHGKSMKAYLIMMSVRLLEMKRLLKPTGSIYLHCDPTASHYLKMVLDSIFNRNNFLSEIVWKRTSAHSSARRFGPVHDIILFYSASDKFVWNRAYTPYDDDYVEKFYRHQDTKGLYRIGDLTASGIRNGESGQPWKGINPGNRHWAPSRSFPGGEELPKSTHAALDALDSMGRIHWPSNGGKPGFKRYLSEMQGVLLQDLWADIEIPKRPEKLGYPTQKPLKLLERIIKASSHEGQMVLDPFCGCATACVAAEHLQREWIGIDLAEKAADLVRHRLADATGIFGKITHRTDIPVRTDVYQMKHYSNFKNELYGRQEGKCAGCGVLFPFRNMTVDHIIPKSKGGQDNEENLQLLCGACNSMKGNRDMAYLLAKLQRMESQT